MDGTYRYHLQDFLISQLPEYHALSYTWGSAVEGKPPPEGNLLIIDGSYLPIGGNLAEFLTVCELAGIFELNNIEWIWIDAVCIDQNDIEEREEQVALMGQIYRGTPLTIVWLGLSATDLDSIQWTNGPFREALVDIIEREGKGRVQQYSFTTEEFYDKLDLSMTYEEYLAIWVRYANFYTSRRWFKRAWVLQEVASVADAVVIAGPGHVFYWNQLMAIARYVAEMNCNVGDNDIGRKINDKICMFMDIQEAVGENRSVMDMYDPLGSVLHNIVRSRSPKNMTCAIFYYMLQHSNAFRATDPRDKVYCALGFANWKRKRRQPPVDIAVSYTKKVEEVFRDTTAYFIRCLKLSVVLSRASGNRGHARPGLPSWVIDFEDSDRGIMDVALAGMFPGNYHSWPFKANDLGPSVVNGDVLSVHGFVAGHVEALCLLPSYPDLEGLIKVLQICKEFKKPRKTPNKSWAEDIADLLVARARKSPDKGDQDETFSDDDHDENFHGDDRSSSDSSARVDLTDSDLDIFKRVLKGEERMPLPAELDSSEDYDPASDRIHPGVSEDHVCDLHHNDWDSPEHDKASPPRIDLALSALGISENEESPPERKDEPHLIANNRSVSENDEPSSPRSYLSQILFRWACLSVFNGQDPAASLIALEAFQDLSELDACLPNKAEMALGVEKLLNEAAEHKLKSTAELQAYLIDDHQGDPWLKEQTWEQEYIRTAKGRCLFRTEEGMLGLAPRWIRSGDEVAFLEGANVPYIVRKVPDAQQYEMKGEAYVHEYMNGEVLTGEFRVAEKVLEIV